MTQNEDSNRRNSVVAVAVLGGGAILFALSNSVGRELLTGWLHFALRVIPRVKVRVDGIAIFAIGALIVCALTHFFLKWLVRESQLKRSVPLVPWRFASSVSLVGIVLLIFAIGISMAGIVHQVGWIMNSPKGLYVSEVQSDEDALRSPYQPGNFAAGSRTSWIFAILNYLPYMQPDIDRSKPWNDESNKSKLQGVIIQALCPSQGYPHKSIDGLGLTHVVGNRAVIECGRKLQLNDIEDSSQTILAGEIQVGFSPWAMPNNGRLPKQGIRQDWSKVPNESLGFGSVHTSGAYMLMLDSSVSFLSDKTDPKVLEQLGRLKVK